MDRGLQELNSRSVPQHGRSILAVYSIAITNTANKPNSTGDANDSKRQNARQHARRPRDVGASDFVSMLATALRDLTASNVATTELSAKMLSRLCMLRDLPSFSDDPMEKLQYKHIKSHLTSPIRITCGDEGSVFMDG